MNPEYDHEAHMAQLRAKFAKEDAANPTHMAQLRAKFAKEDAANPTAPKRDYLEELRQRQNDPLLAQNVIFDDSERDDVDLGADFREENKWADAGRALKKAQSEYQVDPMDRDEPFLSGPEAPEHRVDAGYLGGEPRAMPTPAEPFDLKKLPGLDRVLGGREGRQPLRERELQRISEMEEFLKLKEEGERISPTERPNAFFMDQRGVHEWYNDGRRSVTPPTDWLKRNPKHTNYQDVLRAHQKSQKPGTGVNPAANMKAGSN